MLNHIHSLAITSELSRAVWRGALGREERFEGCDARAVSGMRCKESCNTARARTGEEGADDSRSVYLVCKNPVLAQVLEEILWAPFVPD